MPWKAPQGRGCRCHLGRGRSSGAGITQGTCTGLDTELQHFHLMVGGGVDCCSVSPSAPCVSLAPLWWGDAGGRTGRSSLPFPFRKNFPPACSLNQVTQAFDTWERCRSWWSCQSASPFNRWKDSEICASTETWENIVPVEWAFSFQNGKLA